MNTPEVGQRLSKELESFQSLWKGGYFEGDPLNPLARSTYGELGFMSALHVAYLACIRPYVNAETVALEIGPGHGAWTKALLPAKEVWCMDALPESHNGFYDYLGHPKHVKYLQVNDFSCSDLPDNHFNYMFSFGCLCHVSFAGIEQYARNLFPKLKPGSHCFWMIADYEKYGNALANRRALSAPLNVLPKRGLTHWVLRVLDRMTSAPKAPRDLDETPRPGRWYNAGIGRTCEMLVAAGYTIVDADMGVSNRDPMIHFLRP